MNKQQLVSKTDCADIIYKPQGSLGESLKWDDLCEKEKSSFIEKSCIVDIGDCLAMQYKKDDGAYISAYFY